MPPLVASGARALDLEHPAVPPHELGHPVRARAGSDRGQERLGDRRGVEDADRRVHEQAHARRPGGVLVLDQLIVSGGAAEPGRQDLLEHADDVRIVQRHAAGRDLLVAADGVQVRRPAQLLERTSAGASLDQFA